MLNVFKTTEIHRDVDYSVHQLLAQRIYGIALGYEDVNDHDKLRHDPALEIALSKLNLINSNLGVLARVNARKMKS